MWGARIEVFWPLRGSKAWAAGASVSTQRRTPVRPSQTGPSPTTAAAGMTHSSPRSTCRVRRGLAVMLIGALPILPMTRRAASIRSRPTMWRRSVGKLAAMAVTTSAP